MAAIVSYDHMRTLAERAGESWKSSLIPLAIDGMVIAASTVLLARRRAGQPGGVLAWLALVGGVLVSLAANAAAAQPTLVGRAIALAPPLALALSFELVRSLVCAGNQPSPAHAPATHHDVGDAHQPAPATRRNEPPNWWPQANATANPSDAVGWPANWRSQKYESASGDILTGPKPARDRERARLPAPSPADVAGLRFSARPVRFFRDTRHEIQALPDALEQATARTSTCDENSPDAEGRTNPSDGNS